MNKISEEEFNDFVCVEFDPNSGERFGQAFCNFFNITNDNIFYEVDDNNAYQLMLKYVDN